MGYNLDRAIRIKDLDIAVRERLDSLNIDLLDLSDDYILPGLTDVHVHLREPGFLYKETIRTGSRAAAAGGFTDIFTMPNLNPCPDCLEHLKVQEDTITRDSIVRIYPYGAITEGQQGEKLANMTELASRIIAFTDDGKGVMKEQLMREAMVTARKEGKLIVAHCEDENFPRESNESEWKQLARDIELVRETGCSYHVCHVSTKESVELIRKAKAEGLDITCETAPHYLTINNNEILDDGRYKMNPPIKSEADQQALIEALVDRTIDMIATDHAPHSPREKSGGMADSAYGIVGLETAFPVMYSRFVETGIISFNRLVELMYVSPRHRFGLPVKTVWEELREDAPTFTIWDLDRSYKVKAEAFQTMGRSTPFEGWEVKGRCLATVIEGKLVWRYER